MLKFVDTNVGFEEIPERVSLNIFISHCPFACEGCHSPELQEDIGSPLTKESLEQLLKKNKGVNCVTFMGGDRYPETIIKLGEYIKKYHSELDIAVYSGRNSYPPYFELFDFVKLGEYRKDVGALDSKTTNQRMYKKIGNKYKEITSDFWVIYNR